MAPTIKNVALAGATGNLGVPILKALLAANYNITVLTRSASKHSFPEGVAVKEVDYSSLQSLTEALKGHDAFINSTNASAPADAMRVIDAAVAAGILRYIPPDFGMDPECHGLYPIFKTKEIAYKYIKEQAAAHPSFTYTIVSNGPFFDWGLASGFMGIDLKNKRAGLFDGGENVHTWTNVDDIGKAVANVLAHPEETANRTAYISTVTKSQKQVAQLAQEALPGDWDVSRAPTTEQYKEALLSLQKGIVNYGVIAPLIQYGTQQKDLAHPLEKDDNELLGIRQMTDDEIKQMIKELAA
jgi:uncharacterized protein YbjT (DUF2867 family)